MCVSVYVQSGGEEVVTSFQSCSEEQRFLSRGSSRKSCHTIPASNEKKRGTTKKGQALGKREGIEDCECV